MPVAGENVTVNGNWTILMDINPEPIEFLKIDGDMIIPDYLNNNSRIEAESIWIRAGSLTVGNSSTPYNGTCTIQINGNKEDAGYVFSDEIVGNKQFVVNG